MKDILETKNDLFKPPKIGEIVEGKIIGIEKGALFLDLEAKGTGIIYGREFLEAKEKFKDLKVGDKISAKIIELENEEGYFELSMAAAGKEIAWEELKQKKEKGEIIKVKIFKANKGGLLSEISGIPAFLPVSQLSGVNYPKVEGGESSQILKELQKFINKELEVRILNLDQKSEQIILSERLIEQDQMREFLKNYKVGDIVKGKIVGITDFGVFIRFLSSDLRRPKPTTVGEGRSRRAKKGPSVKAAKGEPAFAKASAGESFALEGLCHISELDWQIIEDPAKVLKVGKIVKAKIIEITNGRVSLSLKALKKDPWKNVEEKYKKGDIVKGKVTKFNPFGAFVEITPKIQGLCHISEFGSQKKMIDTLKIAKKYDFKILLIEPKEHRMSLKLVEK